MFKLFLSLFVFFVLGRNIQNVEGSCTVKLPTDIPKTEPLYLETIGKDRYRLFVPKNETITLKINSTITVACTGNKNWLSYSNVPLNQNSMMRLKCRSGTLFEDDTPRKQILDIRNMNCTKFPESELKMTREFCAKNRGFVYSIGFNLNRHNFLPVLKICYNNKTENTFYADNIINGAAIKYSVIESKRRDFKATGMLRNTFQINSVYTRKNQIERFQEMFGSDQQYINNSMFLSRGHLSPDGDYIFAYEQLATYFYTNVAPEFQSINAGNWVRVENMARDLAADYGNDFEILTGYHDILKLPNKNGQLIEIYLDSARNIEVPKWFFKAIRNLKTNAAIVMITLNNPYAKIEEVVEFCRNVCKRASLESKHFSSFKKGYTFCCEVAEFKRVVNDLPPNLNATSLLNCAHANKIFDY